MLSMRVTTRVKDQWTTSKVRQSGSPNELICYDYILWEYHSLIPKFPGNSQTFPMLTILFLLNSQKILWEIVIKMILYWPFSEYFWKYTFMVINYFFQTSCLTCMVILWKSNLGLFPNLISAIIWIILKIIIPSIQSKIMHN